MQLNQDFSSLFNSNSPGATPQPAAPTPAASAAPSGLTQDFSSVFAPQQQPQTTNAANTAKLDDVLASEGATGLKPIVSAFYGQESSSGANASTSVDGAHGGMQITAGTFAQFAKPGENIDNPTQNMAVGTRILAHYAQQYGGDPAKIAVAYFSGPGNVADSGPTPWKNNTHDGNGTTVAQYVQGILGRIPASSDATPDTSQVPAAPDLSQAPKWTSIVTNPAFQKMTPEDQQATSDAYFQKWIAPNTSPDQLPAVQAEWAQKSAAATKAATPSLLKKVGEGITSAANSLVNGGFATDGVTPDNPAPVGTAVAQPPAGPTAGVLGSGQNLPPQQGATPEQTAALNAQPFVTPAAKQQAFNAYDAATPEQRTAMTQQPGVAGQLAQMRAAQYANSAQQGPNNNTASVENRTAALVAGGDSLDVAQAQAQKEAAAGTPTQAPNSVEPTNFHFDTAAKFANANPTLRGAYKGELGAAQSLVGVAQFGADMLGASDTSDYLGTMAKGLQNKTAAVGEPSAPMQRNYESAVSGIVQVVPALLGAAATDGAEALPMAQNYMQAFGQSYSDGRAQGQTPAEATARSGLMGAFAVLGHAAGIDAHIASIQQAATGATTSDIATSLWNAALRDLPSTQAMALGNFVTDKLPGGVGLNPEAKFTDWLQQAGDMGVQTLMMSGMLGASAIGGSPLARTMRGEVAPAFDQSSNTATDKNGNYWRVEPTFNNLAIGSSGAPGTSGNAPHPSQTAADQAVQNIAAIHGIDASGLIPEDTPVPQPVAQPAAPEAAAPTGEQPQQIVPQAGQPLVWSNGSSDVPVIYHGVAPDRGPDGRLYAQVGFNGKMSYVPFDELRPGADTPPAVPTAEAPPVTAQTPDESVSAPATPPGTFDPAQVKEFAQQRREALQDKQTGTLDTTMAPTGHEDVQSPGQALTPTEKMEWDALSQHANDPAALARFYGLHEPDLDPAAPSADVVNAAAHEAATSPENTAPEPTQAQKEAGNYAKGHVEIHGLDVSIENPQGSERSGTDADGVVWKNTMQDHYGYIRRTVGADDEQIDTFVGQNPASKKVFVVDQNDPNTGKFDEHKVMLGYDSMADADAAYHRNYEPGWNGRGAISEMPIGMFKEWLERGDTKSPFAKDVSTSTRSAGAKPKTEKEAIAAREPKVVSTYKTAKGSVYQVHEDGSTTRDKAARTDVGHEGDSGLKQRSAKTVYVADDASRLSAAGLRGLDEKGARVAIKDGKANLLTWNQAQGKWGASPSGRNVEIHDSPALGLHPLELWKPADDVPGYEAYRGMHAGNKITELDGKPAPAAPPKTEREAKARKLEKANGSSTETQGRASDGAKQKGTAARPVAGTKSGTETGSNADHPADGGTSGIDRARSRVQPRSSGSERTAAAGNVKPKTEKEAKASKEIAAKLAEEDARYTGIFEGVNKAGNNLDAALANVVRIGSTPEIREYAQQLLDLDLKAKLIVQKKKFRNMPFQTEGEYWRDSHTINVRPGDADAARDEYLVMHEATHAALVRLVAKYQGMTDPKTPEEVRIVDAIQKLEAIRQVALQVASGKEHYGLTNLDEFLAELKTKPKFQEFLKSEEINGQSLWDRTTSALKAILGMLRGKGSYFDQAISAVDTLLGRKSAQESRAEPKAEAPPKTEVEARKARVERLVGKVGDIVTASADFDYVKAGKPMHIERVEKSGAVRFVDPVSGSGTTVTHGTMDSALRKVTFEKVKPAKTDDVEPLTEHRSLTDDAPVERAGVSANDMSGFARDSSLLSRPEADRTSALTTLRRLNKKLESGALTDAEFRLGAQQLLSKLEDKRDGQLDRQADRTRERGDLYIRERLLRAVRQGDIEKSTADFAQWLLDKNPAIADDLGIGLRTAKDHEGSTAGMYNSMSRVVTLFKGNTNPGTAVHEILHHTERMMPTDIRSAIYKAWARDWKDAYAKATEKQKPLFGQMLAASLGSKTAWDKVAKGFADGTLNYDEHYKLVNPSEYWAVKATDLMKSRFDAKSWIARAKQWLSEMVQKVKSILGLNSDAPIIEGVESVLKGEGDFTTHDMMTEKEPGQQARDITALPDHPTEDQTALHGIYRDITKTPTERADDSAGRSREFVTKSLDTKKSAKSFNWLEKTFASQVHKAIKDPDYGRVFNSMRKMMNHTGLASTRPAELAPMILPKSDHLKQSVKTLFAGKRQSQDVKDAMRALLDGTLAGDSVLKGKTFSPDELRANYGMSAKGIEAYTQARKAIDASLDEVSSAEAWSMAQGFVPKELRESIINDPVASQRLIRNSLDGKIGMLQKAHDKSVARKDFQKAEILHSLMAPYLETRKKIDDIYDKAEMLKSAGYLPLMRFGKYTVYAHKIDPETGLPARDPETDQPLVHYFGMFPTEAEARTEHARQLALYHDDPDIRVERGVKSEKGHQLYDGVSPETLALFADKVGADEAMKTVIQLAMSERSALKRRLGRRAITGYSEDLPRILSNFITSNGRFTAQRFYMRDVNRAIQEIPKAKGDVTDEAIKLKQFVLNGDDPGSKTMAGMFLWTMAGSPVSAAVIASEPFQKIFPYLSQFGVGRATVALGKSLHYVLGRKQITDPALRAAMQRAAREGIIKPQEIFHLYDMGMQNMSTWLSSQLAAHSGPGAAIAKGVADGIRARATAFTTILGMMHSAAETFGRKMAFHAAWEVATARGEKDPYAWTVRAIDEAGSQFGKINRSNIERTYSGRMMLAYKQFTIGWLGLLFRMARKGGVEGARGALVMLATQMAMGGLQGLPFMQNMDDLIDTIGNFMGHNTDFARTKRVWAQHSFGKEFGDMFMHGVARSLPVDLSEHFGMGDIVPGMDMLKASEAKDKVRNLLNVLGPQTQFATRLMDAYDAAASGNYGKAGIAVAPNFIKRPLQGAQMLESGQSTDTQGRKIADASTFDAVAKMAGGATAHTNEQTEMREEVQQAVGTVQDKQAQIVNMWARGIVKQDPAVQQQARDALMAWNDANPDTRIVVTPQALSAQVKQMRLDANTRAILAAPKGLKADAASVLRPAAGD